MWQIELEPLQFRISNIVIDGTFASKVGASAALSHLLPQEWVKIGTQTSAQYLDFVASLIVHGTATARSELFKVLGKVVSNFYHPLRTESLSSLSVHEETVLCERLISVTLEGCVDPSPNVRCMALFGLGNLWRLAVRHPGCPVPACIHRAPDTAPLLPPRLLLIS